MRLALFALLALSAAASAEPLTVDQLIAKPDRYAGQDVRVVGQIDNCVARACNLCPEDMTRASFDEEDCVMLVFDGDDSVRRAMGEAYRFSDVIVDARFGSERELALSDARVARVLSRKVASEGLVSAYREGRLIEAERDDARAMQAEWDRLGLWSGDPVRFFRIARYSLQRANASAAGLGCACLRQGCDRYWPTHYFGGFNAPGNPYRCYEMARFDDGWRLLPD
ncbi:MAG TPA: hypothetical protein VGF56_09125 [Rhizomicrobium sp.]|jgi:hypothetical protein